MTTPTELRDHDYKHETSTSSSSTLPTTSLPLTHEADTPSTASTHTPLRQTRFSLAQDRHDSNRSNGNNTHDINNDERNQSRDRPRQSFSERRRSRQLEREANDPDAEEARLQLAQTYTPTAISAPDGLPVVKGHNMLSKPTTFWIGTAIITVDLGVMPIAYYYAFKYGTHLDLQENFAVITGIFGMFCFAHYAYRSMKLLILKSARKKCRPLGWTKMGIAEFFHVNIAIAIFLIEVELVVGTIFDPPVVRLIAMASATLYYYFGFLAIVTQIFADMRLQLPFNQSSTPKGEIWRPAVLVITEDFGAIELGGERMFRAHILARYDASPDFRRMIRNLSWFIGLSEILSSTIATILIMLLNEDAGYGLGWGLPHAATAAIAVLTYVYVKKCLRKEHANWDAKVALEGAPPPPPRKSITVTRAET